MKIRPGTGYKPDMAGKSKSDGLFNFSSDIFTELFSSFTGETKAKSGNSKFKTYRDSSDEKGLTMEIELPGLSPKDVQVWAVDNQLVVRNEKFTNRYTLSNDFDLFTAKAKMSHGLLTVWFARLPKKDAKRITIDTE